MISIIIRTCNEEKYISKLLHNIISQKITQPFEIILVDSGSHDQTLEIAARFSQVRIIQIRQEDFSYGYALNYGLQQAQGEIAVSISAHCIPINKEWLNKLIQPLSDPTVAITYGRQIGPPTARLSERRIFQENFPDCSRKYSEVTYNHNANSAFRMEVWRHCPFDEELPGLEDQDYALKVAKKNLKSQYVPHAAVLHFHQETNDKVFNRYYRETLSLQTIQPTKPPSLVVILFRLSKSVVGDILFAYEESLLKKAFLGIIGFRFSQYFAVYLANHGLSARGMNSLLQNWLIKKISRGSSSLARLKKEGVLKREYAMRKQA